MTIQASHLNRERNDNGHRHLIAADTGGTFTDLAVYDAETGAIRFGKTLTTYGDLVEGVIAGLEDTSANVGQASLFKHGTAHVINAFIQRRGARTALVTTRGFRDVLEIARGNRPETFNLRYRRNPPLVPRSLRFEVDERMDGQGQVLRPLDIASVEELVPLLRKAGVESVAVSFLNAYANSAHEERACQILRELMPESMSPPVPLCHVNGWNSSERRQQLQMLLSARGCPGMSTASIRRCEIAAFPANST